ncbi:helix-turn-helix transcriptional regulator [Chromobacterium sp. TRC.1.1.SA]|uniref:Helix-turn-helix transcriptional regulator n=1 Tax=Chromobacterium indicum TaxID=3110228 RepID=A0ABV0CMX8_9NEIS|nr:helix-turn-helix transcriptional regulator [Chromobacterium violaceum]MBP4051745.1 helix-turn-helix transcriptional regulator [Chromobacterium violaceum]
MAGHNEIWGMRLKEARLKAGLSQKQLGIQAGLDPSVASTRINRYELGIHKADYQIAQHLAAVLGVPTAYFYAEDDELAKWILAFTQLHEEQRANVHAWLAD